MTFTALENSYPLPRPAPDGWTPEWRLWFDTSQLVTRKPDRSAAVIRAVRAALRRLGQTERLVIEMYYYDGLSWSHIGDRLGLSVHRSRAIQRRALIALERRLAPFVRATFCLDAVRQTDCPICTAPWRSRAEELFNEKTANDTWGQIGRRLTNAVGWKATTPQILITHQKHHRGFEPAQSARQSFDDLFEISEEEE